MQKANKMNTPKRKIMLPNGLEVEISSDDLSYGHLILLEVTIEMCVARGNNIITIDDVDEIASRVRAKGYVPWTYEPIN
ncbi:hypothetical protein F6R98_05855 [Candidatus Methylospira mobilis]|uniref:Uncharacterized protein n=1 Tax=Candidatus Methylospira mobilis TaxID=1808979 RepID=A0A5Q0BJ32_9GAMM|nr:hypothetical protein [Candidatus Methylospira mobilis]QFY42211.1 hypothetical protein F6R98_05855 [Candidatus Methylospira mobilis]WNV03228.1 hypothetical protein RP726_12210 [Candidatus Methylospira mobilis]